MRSDFNIVLCFALAIFCLTGAENEGLFEKRLLPPRMDIKPPNYCPLDPKIVSFISELRGPLYRSGVKGIAGASRHNSKV